MIALEQIRNELLGKESDRSFIIRAIKKYGNLPVKISLLSNATLKKLHDPFWIGCPPGVFLSYKWNGPASKAYVEKIHDYLTHLGYRVYFDQNEIDELADGYTEVPEYIANVAKCQYFVLFLTEITADFITARNNKTSWIFDEYQQALKIINLGKMVLVPLLIEEKGQTDFFNKNNTIDLTEDNLNFKKLNEVFYPIQISIDESTKIRIGNFLVTADKFIIASDWEFFLDLFKKYIVFKNIPDYQFRLLIYEICTRTLDAGYSSYHYCSQFMGQRVVTRLLSCYSRIYAIKSLEENLIYYRIT